MRTSYRVRFRFLKIFQKNLFFNFKKFNKKNCDLKFHGQMKQTELSSISHSIYMILFIYIIFFC